MSKHTTPAKEISVALVKDSDSDSHSGLRTQDSGLSLSLRAQRVMAYHTGVIAAFGQQMGYAFLCGLELNAAKEEIAHGAFEKWREANLPELPRSTANNYRNFATLLQEKSKALGNLVQKLLPASTDTQNSGLRTQDLSLADADRAEILAAVHDVTDGKTLTQLYRDLGVIRDKIHQKDRDNSRKQNPPTAEDQKALNVSITHRLANDARAWRTTAAIQKDCETSDLSMLLDELVATSSHIRQLMKSRRSSAATRAGHNKKKGKK